MRVTFLKSLLLMLTLALGGCERNNVVPIAEADQQSARSYVEMLRGNRLDEIIAHADPSLDAGNVRAELDKMAAQFPAEAPKSVKLVRSRVVDGMDPAGNQAQRVEMMYEYLFPSASVLANVALKRTASATMIVSFNAARIPDDFNDFTLAGRSTAHYVALLFALAVPVLTLWTLIVCLRMPMETTQKVLWCLFIAVSIGRFSIDWVTGLWTATPLALLPFGVTAVRNLGGYGPWVVSVGLPVGAIAFHFWRARKRAGAAPPTWSQ